MAKSNKPTKTHKMIDDMTQDLPRPQEVVNNMPYSLLTRFGKMKIIYVIIAILSVSTLLVVNKDKFIAAIVNGRPIWRWQLNDVLTKRFGEQTLEGIISEKLIENAAKSAKVSINPQQVAAREQEIVASLGSDVTLEQLLQYQGITKEDFDSQVRLQLVITELLGKDIQITDQDVANFIATSSSLLSATDPATLQKEARDTIREQKIGEKLQPWFLELKEKAQILKFL